MSGQNQTEINYSALFNAFSSWGYEGAEEGNTLEEILTQIADSDFLNEDTMATYQILCDAVEKNPEIANARIYGQSWNDPSYNDETKACIFKLENGDSYVTYCGTGDGGWIDNAHGVTEDGTQQQEEAARYFDDMATRYGWTESDNIIVTGHSKGGNKAQFITLQSENRELIDTCYSMDGQGFSDAAIEKFRRELGEGGYQAILDKMYAINGYNDYVSPLINPIIPDSHTIYLETTTHPKGDLASVYMGWHMIQMYFQTDENGDFISLLTPETQRGQMGDLAEQLSQYLMSLPLEEREAAAMVIMQLMESMEGGKTGIDGDSLSLDDILTFDSETLIPLIWQVIGSDSGRKVLKDIFLRLLDEHPKEVLLIAPIVIFFSPVLITFVFTAAELMGITKKICDMLEALGEAFAKAAAAFADFLDGLASAAQGFAEWISNLIFKGDSSWFCADPVRMRRLDADLFYQQARLLNAAQQIRTLRREIDFGILIKSAVYFKLTTAARNLEKRAENIEKLREILERCSAKYTETENKIVGQYEAV